MSTIQVRPPGRVRLTVEEFARIQDSGLFEGRHVQLLDGELYEVTKNPLHNFAVSALADALRSLLPRDEYAVREEKSIEPWVNWWPEPDIAVARGKQRRYEDRHPGPEDLALLVEVTESSEQDRTKKLVGYAAAGIPIYWILDLALRRLEVYRDPGPSGYSVEEMIPEGGFVELVIDQRSFGWIAVAEILPRAM
ncbi:MAG: Uma2 family endonuclease [Planctomycetaceae bacterium]|nr:Uma2 family endonuclease [Planctomycetaceae bacterium]